MQMRKFDRYDGLVWYTLILCVTFSLLAGCASMSAPNLSADQLKEATKDKGLTVACLTFTGVGGSGNSVIISYDQRTIANGGIAVDPRNGCAVTLNNTAKPAEPIKVVP